MDREEMLMMFRELINNGLLIELDLSLEERHSNNHWAIDLYFTDHPRGWHFYFDVTNCPYNPLKIGGWMPSGQNDQDFYSSMARAIPLGYKHGGRTNQKFEKLVPVFNLQENTVEQWMVFIREILEEFKHIAL